MVVDNGYGGAIAWDTADDLNVHDVVLTNNRANAGGAAIYIYEGNDVLLYNLTVTDNVAKDTGAVTLLYLTDLKINNTIFDNNHATAGQAGAIYTSNTVGTIYNSTFTNNTAALYGSALSINYGNISLISSRLDGEDQILILRAIANLKYNNITNASAGEYSVLNEGNLSLEKNNFSCRIINVAYILTDTNTTILNNQTVIAPEGSNVDVNATIVDDNGNIIVVRESFLFNDTIFNVTRPSAYVGNVNYGTFYTIGQGIHVINASEGGLLKNHVRTGTIIARGTSNITFEIIKSNERSEVTINAYIHPDSIRGNISFYINGVFKGNKTIENGFATLTLNNYTAGTYTLTATNVGDTIHFGSSNTTFFVINLFKTNLSVVVENVVYGQNATAIATTNANGTLTFIINGKEEEVPINTTTGQAILDISGLRPGNYTVWVIHEKDGYYDFAYNRTTFTVNKLNTTVDVDVPASILVGQNATVDITLNTNITGKVILSVNNTNYTVNVVNGIGSYNVTGLAYGPYVIKVFFEGNDIYNANASDVKNLMVNKNPVTVTVDVNDTIKVGEDAIVQVTLSEEDINGYVIVTVNNKNYTLLITNGRGNLTLSNLPSGSYKVNATFAGNDKYNNAVSNNDTLVVDKIPTDINVTVKAPVYYGDNAVITIRMNVTVNGTATLRVDTANYTVAIVNGVGTYNVSGLAYGPHDVFVKFIEDNKYQTSDNTTTFNVLAKPLNVNVTAQNVTVEQNTSFIL
jgi:hypothetical protein